MNSIVFVLCLMCTALMKGLYLDQNVDHITVTEFQWQANLVISVFLLQWSDCRPSKPEILPHCWHDWYALLMCVTCTLYMCGCSSTAMYTLLCMQDVLKRDVAAVRCSRILA